MRPTLGQFFVGVAVVVAATIGVGAYRLEKNARVSLAHTAEVRQSRVAQLIAARVQSELGRAERVLDDIARELSTRAFVADDLSAVELALFSHLLDDPRLEEVSFTRAERTGYAADGSPLLGPSGRVEISLVRRRDGAITTRIIRPDGATYALDERRRDADNRFDAPSLSRAGPTRDPTLDHTFTVPASRAFAGSAIWSDLHWSELDAALPEPRRRVVLSVQKALSERERFLGVVRVSIDTRELDAIARGDDERVVLMSMTPDAKGVRLVARVTDTDRTASIEGEIRVVSDRLPDEVGQLLASPIVRGLSPNQPTASGTLMVAGSPWLATVRPIELGRGGTEGWMVAVLVPESRYTAELVGFERTILAGAGATMLVVILIGAVTILSVRRALARIVEATARMRAFDFTPTSERSFFRDLDEVGRGLERAKTVVRAMGKYVPIDLVKRLYERNEEPRLGGELTEVSLLFTDIEGFTTLAERLPPDELARHLGDYLEAMTVAIEGTGGTIDKYIGDAVMALWNAPSPVVHDAKRACEAVLACQKAADALYASKAWEGLPRLVTRFGLHRARVMVGHFGAPTRLGYTALGDGVNLAARLEPLCKQYGVVVLASEAIVREAEDAFAFRLVDRVAVKGKTEGIAVYELLGPKEASRSPAVIAYEEAFVAYVARDFLRAAAILESHAGDGPTDVLLARCRKLAVEPPNGDWAGVHVATSK